MTLANLRLRLRGLFRRSQLDRDLDDELRHHLALRQEKLANAGSPSALPSVARARERARREFGNAATLKEESRDLWTFRAVEILLQDVRYSLRALRKNPGFAAVAILTLALGIGANTAVFSVVNSVLIDPLPYPNPDQLLFLRQTGGQSFSYLNFLDLQSQARSFSTMGFYRSDGYNLGRPGAIERVSARMISAGFLKTFGTQPLIGRDFTSDDDRLGTPLVAMLSENLWRQKFNSDSSVIGNPIFLNGKSFAVIGVVPASFQFFQGSPVFVLAGQWDNGDFRARNGTFGSSVIARMKPGVSLQQARTDLDCVGDNLAATYPEVDAKMKFRMTLLKDSIVDFIETTLLTLLAAVAFVLLIACANVANLLLARSSARRREFAVRAALGAARTRLVRQMLTESVVLALIGGGLGTILAAWGTRLLLARAPYGLPNSGAIGISPRVLLFTLGISLVTGMVFGLAPALKSRAAPQESLREGARGSSSAHGTQRIFVVGEVALAMVLLVGAGLLIRSLARVLAVDPGFNPRNLYALSLGVSPQAVANPSRIRTVAADLPRAIESIPGIDAAAFSLSTLPVITDGQVAFWRSDQPKPANERDMSVAQWYAVTPDYLRTMGIPLVRGRFISAEDAAGAPTVAVIDQDFARLYFKNQDPIGQRLSVTFFSLTVQIVGIAGDVKQYGLEDLPKPEEQYEIYLSAQQVPGSMLPLLSRYSELVVRSSMPPEPLAAAVRKEVFAADNQQVIYAVRSMESVLESSLASRRFTMLLIGVFAAIALLLATIGIYGVISFVVGQRTREIGIRMALGARPAQISGMIVRGSFVTIFSGIVIGSASAIAVGRWLSSLLFGVRPWDPLTLASVAAILVAVAFAACLIPARRAMRVDPITALRYE